MIENGPECSFQFHEFTEKVGDLPVSCHFVKMENSLYVWLGNSQENSMQDLSFAIESKFEKDPLVTKIIGPLGNDASTNLAKRLAKKLGKPVYVSFNLPTDNMSLREIEKRLHQEFQANPDFL